MFPNFLLLSMYSTPIFKVCGVNNLKDRLCLPASRDGLHPQCIGLHHGKLKNTLRISMKWCSYNHILHLVLHHYKLWCVWHTITEKAACNINPAKQGSDAIKKPQHSSAGHFWGWSKSGRMTVWAKLPEEKHKI